MQEAHTEILDVVPLTLKYPVTHLTYFLLRFPISEMEESLLHSVPQGEGTPWKSTYVSTYVRIQTILMNSRLPNPDASEQPVPGSGP